MSSVPAIAVHHTATVDASWDGPAAVAAMPNDDAVLRYCHAWQTPEAADADHESGDDDADDRKSSYKFPHHAKKGGPANLAACRNGLARLDSASIPTGDKSAVKAHLQAHLNDAKGAEADAIAYLSNAERVAKNLVRAKRHSEVDTWYALADGVDDAPAELALYDEIGFWGVSAVAFKAQLNAITASAISVNINSPGGDVFDGIAIMNMLRAHPATVNVVVDGMAASAASFIAMAGDTVIMAPGAMMMIHDASGICQGDAADMLETAGLLDTISDNIAAIYAGRAGGTTAQWRETMKGEQWYTADEAVAARLADKVAATPKPKKAKAHDDSIWNLSLFRHPARAVAPAPKPPAPAPVVRAFDPETLRAALKGMTT